MNNTNSKINHYAKEILEHSKSELEEIELEIQDLSKRRLEILEFLKNSKLELISEGRSFTEMEIPDEWVRTASHKGGSKGNFSIFDPTEKDDYEATMGILADVSEGNIEIPPNPTSTGEGSGDRHLFNESIGQEGDHSSTSQGGVEEVEVNLSRE